MIEVFLGKVLGARAFIRTVFGTLVFVQSRRGADIGTDLKDDTRELLGLIGLYRRTWRRQGCQRVILCVDRYVRTCVLS